MTYRYLYISLILLLAACSKNVTNEKAENNEYNFQTPLHFPKASFPAHNPYSKAKAELGRHLFYEPLLVKDTSFPACSHCMQQQAAFSNNIQIARGYNRQAEKRNNMTLVNSVYRSRYFWDARGTAIEGPAYRSLFLKGIFASDTNEIVKRLQEQKNYPELFRKAFGDNEISAYRISLAIATFVRTMVSGNSKYDQFINGSEDIFTESEKRGKDLFFSKRTNCSVCHSGIFFTDELLHNTGVTTHYFDRGREFITGKLSDRGKFLTPTLRNVEVTGPYMHDGELRSLEEVMEHYNRGGRLFATKDTLMKPLGLKKTEIEDIINFLKTLTDRDFLDNESYSNPFKQNKQVYRN